MGFEIGSVISASAPISIAFIIGRLALGGRLCCGTLTLMGHPVPVNERHFLRVAACGHRGAQNG